MLRYESCNETNHLYTDAAVFAVVLNRTACLSQALKSIEIKTDKGLYISSFNRFQTSGYPLPVLQDLISAKGIYGYRQANGGELGYGEAGKFMPSLTLNRGGDVIFTDLSDIAHETLHADLHENWLDGKGGSQWEEVQAYTFEFIMRGGLTGNPFQFGISDGNGPGGQYVAAMINSDTRYGLSDTYLMNGIYNFTDGYSINSLTEYLQSLGHKAPKSTVSDFMAWFEDAYFLFTVRIFDASIARANTNPKKIYCIDHAMVRSVASGILVNSGHLLENLIFTALRRVTPHIYYYKTRKGREVDFVVQLQDRSRNLIQVCESMADPTTRKREVAALQDAMSEMNMTSGVIVTRLEDEQITVDAGTIDVVPAWKFLLDYSET